jgi:hypothetical protein
MLARVDQMSFEGSLLPAENTVRAALHVAVREKDERAAAECLGALRRVATLEASPLTYNPTLARGRRRLAHLRIERGADVSMLSDAIERLDAVTVRELIAHA